MLGAAVRAGRGSGPDEPPEPTAADERFPYAGGVIPIEQSAPELGAFVSHLLAATGARKVDLVGHSEGTFMPAYWLKFLGGARHVGRYVAMMPPYRGTQLGGFAALRDAADA